jgi:DNA-binding PadR family transcriptional regulator
MIDKLLEKARKRYLPMSETMFYILLSLKEERHGYGIMQRVKELTQERIKLGAGTVYSSLAKLEDDRLIRPVREDDRRKIYLITPIGEAILREEAARIKELYSNSKEML